MRANLFLRSHTMVYTYCLLLLLAHRPDGSYYALWFLPRAAFWCLFAPSFAHARPQRGNIVVSSYSGISERFADWARGAARERGARSKLRGQAGSTLVDVQLFLLIRL